MVLLELPEVLFRGLLCPARTACMGGKGVGAEFHCPVLAHWRSPVPSLRFRAWRCVTVERSMGLENGRCQRPTGFTEVRCCVDSCNVSPNQQGFGGQGERWAAIMLPMALWLESSASGGSGGKWRSAWL
jgi:hypothetical protein